MLKRIFSVKNEGYHKIVTILGIKIKLKSLALMEKELKKRELEKRNKEKELPILDYLEIQLVDHCNLNCKACSHFCSLAPEKFADLDDIKGNLEELLKKVQISHFRLLGGEPLLHPDINNFMYETRKLMPFAQISILTNGLLLLKMSESFWNSCKENGISIDITKYPVTNNIFSDIIDICDKHEVFISGISAANNFYHWMNRKGDSNPDETFNACKSKFGLCYILRDSKISTCPTAVYMDYYNNHFGQNVPVDCGIDIFKHTGIEIVEHLKHPIETCKYCANLLKLEGIPWERTTRQEDEWDCDKSACCECSE